MTSSQQDQLKRLIRLFFTQNEFGYTLFGNKPISFCFIPPGTAPVTYRGKVFPALKQGEKSYLGGAKLLTEYLNLCPRNHYCLKVFFDQHQPSFAVIINKCMLKKTISVNIDLFRCRYGKNLNFKLILNDLLKKETYYNYLFEDHLLLGVLLGYGRHNAELFQKRSKFEYQLSNCNLITMNTKEQKLKSMTAEFNQYLKPSSYKDFWTTLVNPVRFAVDLQSPQTKELLKHYDACHQLLTKIFKQADWLDIILQKISEDPT